MNSHKKLPWKEGEPVHLAVHAELQPDGRTSYAGYAQLPKEGWQLVSKLTTRSCGGSPWLGQANSFLEVWQPSPLCEHRKAHYGPLFWRAATPADGLKQGLRKEAQPKGWQRAERVGVSATCGFTAGHPVPCPSLGLDARPDVLELGRATSDGQPVLN